MSFARQFREEITRECSFLESERNEELPHKRTQPPPRNQSPAPRTSSKNQIEKLKVNLDSEAKQRRVEEFKKKAAESKIIMSNEVEESDSIISTPDFKREPKKVDRPKAVRTEFPVSLIFEYPFLDSPIDVDEIANIIKLTDERYGRQEVESVISRIVLRKP